MGTRTPSTCVIGAGLSGLVATKALRERGLPVETFEMSDRVGGNWAFKNPNRRSSAYRSLHIDTSKERLGFSDFPMPDDYPDFPSHEQVHAYFESYVDRFRLAESIRFRTEVRHARRLEGGGWELELSDGGRRHCDALIVANGHHWDPRWPEPAFPGEFAGRQIHSHEYIDPTEPIDMRGKRILVVGIGNSAVDIASELSRRDLAEKAFISTRRGAYVIPKYVFGRPIDTIMRTMPHVPLGLQKSLARGLMRITVGRMENYGLPTPDHKLLEAHPTVSSELLVRLGSGDLAAKPDIRRLDGTEVEFTDGSRERIDVIIYATGYRITFPFFDEEFISAPDNRLPLFKRMIKPGVDDLIMIGFAQAIPTLFPFCERQARWAAAYLAGDYALPDIASMEAIIRADEKRDLKHFVKSKRHTMQVDTAVYEWGLDAEESAGRARAAAGTGRRLAPGND
ncbi:flavin-containing monooxygenase [Rhodococcus sp. UNC363MFTsu5.1]|uniref:flavin-containing monooxygenase n=1 Tax=Rhodococcus sp. UNC363MFTsu5.1 TaxID=1449069 RepID=UPI000690B418|nr:NAD(P)-binding domain-containing protein [Rhodococcus sp. UNC363MFTsu5.1]